MSRISIRSRRLLQAAVVVMALALAGGVGIWHSRKPAPGVAQADSSIPGMDTLKTVEDALEAIVTKVTPAVVRIEAEQAPTQTSREQPQSSPEDLFKRFFGEPFGTPGAPGPQVPAQPATSLGSGVIISSGGYVLTARHVVNGSDRITVELDSGEKLKGRVLAMDSETDLAVVKVDSDKPLPAAGLGDADQLKAGAYVIAIGSPFGLKHSVSVGHVSGLERTIPRAESEGRPFRHMLQTDAAINRGNSGGPLVDIDGNVVGINNMIITPTSFNVGVGFAVAINNDTKGVIKTLEKGEQVQRGLLGVTIIPVDPAIAEHYGVKEGAFVNEVNSGSAAEKAGIKDEDVIVRFGGTEIKTPDDLVSAVEKTRPGTRVPVTVVRDEKNVNLDVVVGSLESKPEVKVAAATPGGPLGLTVASITQALAERYNLETQHGVVVTGLEPGADGARAGVMPGDVLLSINRKPIETTKDYDQALKSLKPGSSVVIRIARADRKYTLTIDKLGE